MKKFETPVVEITTFAVEDVVTTSAVDTCPEDWALPDA